MTGFPSHINCPRRTHTWLKSPTRVKPSKFLLKFDEWCPEWLEYVKESEGITDLNEDHQKILDFLQDYYRKNGIAPMVRILSKNTGYKLKEVYELFPSGWSAQAHRLRVIPS